MNNDLIRSMQWSSMIHHLWLYQLVSIARYVYGTADLTVLSRFRFCSFHVSLFQILDYFRTKSWPAFVLLMFFQIIDTFLDTVMSVVLTKTEIIGGSVDGTVRTFDMRIGRYVKLHTRKRLWYCISSKNQNNWFGVLF